MKHWGQEEAGEGPRVMVVWGAGQGVLRRPHPFLHLVLKPLDPQSWARLPRTPRPKTSPYLSETRALAGWDYPAQPPPSPRPTFTCLDSQESEALLPPAGCSVKG